MLHEFKTVSITEFLRINGSCKLFGILCCSAEFETSDLVMSRLNEPRFQQRNWYLY